MTKEQIEQLCYDIVQNHQINVSYSELYETAQLIIDLINNQESMKPCYELATLKSFRYNNFISNQDPE